MTHDCVPFNSSVTLLKGNVSTQDAQDHVLTKEIYLPQRNRRQEIEGEGGGEGNRERGQQYAIVNKILQQFPLSV